MSDRAPKKIANRMRAIADWLAFYDIAVGVFRDDSPEVCSGTEVVDDLRNDAETVEGLYEHVAFLEAEVADLLAALQEAKQEAQR